MYFNKMLKKIILIFLALLNSMLIHVETGLVNNEILFEDPVKNYTQFDAVPLSDTPNLYPDHDGKKVLNIVVNPVIHNIAHGYGGGATTVSPVTPTEPPLILDILRVFLRKVRFMAQFLFNSFTSVVRGSFRFIFCSFVPICGLFGVLGDETSPESVARGLDFLQGIIEKYRSAQNFIH